MVKEVEISPAIVHYFAIFFSKNDHEIKLVVLHTINPQNSTKWMTTFSWIFHFLLIDFTKKIFEIFLTNAKCLWGMWNNVQGHFKIGAYDTWKHAKHSMTL